MGTTLAFKVITLFGWGEGGVCVCVCLYSNTSILLYFLRGGGGGFSLTKFTTGFCKLCMYHR